MRTRRPLPPAGPTAPGRAAALALLAALAVLAPVRAAAHTLLVATREAADGEPCPAPLPLAEGLSAALFAAGHIAFGEDGPGPEIPVDQLLSVAREGGAAWLLLASADFTERAGPGNGAVRVEARTRWSLWRAADGRQAGTGTLAASNEGRERTVDSAALGAELGAAVVRALEPFLGPGS